MKHKKMIVWTIVFLVIIVNSLNVLASFGIDDTRLGTFKQDSNVTLFQTCANCSYVMFTRVVSPHGEVLLENEHATKQDTTFTYDFNQTTRMGEYKVYGVGDMDGVDEMFAYSFMVEQELDIMKSSYLAILTLLVFGIILLGYIINVNIVSMLGSLGLVMTSLSLFSINTAIALILLFSGLILALYFAIKQY